MTRTKAAKLLYLWDLRTVESLGRRATSVQWLWRHHGPFDNDLLTVEQDLVSAHLMERQIGENAFGSPEYRLWIADKALGLVDEINEVCEDEEVLALLEQVMDELGGLAPSTLRDMTYQTAPMLEAQAGGAREVELDLATARPLVDLDAIGERFSAILDDLPVQETDAAALEDVGVLLDELAGHRGLASRELLSEHDE